MSESILVFEPTAPCNIEPQRLRKPLDELAGKVVGFIDNGKPNFNHLVDDLAALLIGKYGVVSVLNHRKPGQIPVATDALKAITEQCDAVVTGSGD